MKLMEHLSECHKDELKDMARELGFPAPPYVKAEEIAETLLKPEVIASRLSLLTDSQMSMFERACEEMLLPNDDEFGDALALKKTLCAFQYRKKSIDGDMDVRQFLEFGRKNPEAAAQKMVDIFKSMLQIYLSVPEEIAAVYRTVNTSAFQERRHKLSWLSLCLTVAGKLYAVTPLSILARLYALREPIQEQELRQLLTLLPKQDGGWVYDEATDRILCRPMEEQEVQAILDRQGDYEFYIPEAEHIEDLAGEYYPFALASYRSFSRFLKDYCGLNNFEVDKAVQTLWDMLSKDATDLQDDIQWMIDQTGADAGIFTLILRLYENCRVETRSVTYRGHMRKELPLTPDVLTPQHRDLDVTFDMALPKIRIGRNDPCPCGSGKKYKKCCGR